MTPVIEKLPNITDKEERVKTPFLVQHYGRRNLFWRNFFMPRKIEVEAQTKTKNKPSGKYVSFKNVPHLL